MKKIMSLLLAVLILSLNAFAASRISYSEMDTEVYNGFVKAIKEDNNHLFNDLYSLDWNVREDAEVTSVKVIANVNGNYIIRYVYGDMVVDSSREKVFGDFAIYFNGCGYCVYSATEDKVMSIEKAYNDGLITEEDFLEIQLYHINNKSDESVYFGTRLSDINSDGLIDIIDLAMLRSRIINTHEHPITVNERGFYPDINHDGFVDIVDVVMLRDIIINSK